MTKAKIIIGIDPDVDGSGVGVVNLSTRDVSKQQLRLPELIAFLKEQDDINVFIEAGWLNKGNYHLKNKGQWHASKIGEQIGRNHEVSKIIGEFCEFHGITYQFVRPLVKHWKGKDGKITHDELMSLIDGSGLLMNKCRTNQETRDALLLAIVHSGLPLRTKPNR